MLPHWKPAPRRPACASQRGPCGSSQRGTVPSDSRLDAEFVCCAVIPALVASRRWAIARSPWAMANGRPSGDLSEPSRWITVYPSGPAVPVPLLRLPVNNPTRRSAGQ
ncbi:hypothetical protein GQ53DRAFT_225881 [Thozetella sp. PMI_491]|nr:hypothetical protein GQ53DRAFT_225881 [Thozetella sp. PMI_491]